MAKSLLSYHTLPPFSAIKVEEIESVIDSLIDDNRRVIETVLKQTEFSWDNFIVPLEQAGERLSQAFSPISHLHAVMNTPELREVYERCVEKLATFSAETGQNEHLYRAYLAIASSDEYEDLDPAQHKVIENAIRDFKLSGVALAPKQKLRFIAIQQRLSQLTTQFENNVLDATHGWHYHTTDLNELSGLPEHALLAAQHLAQDKHLEGYALGLDFPSYYAVSTYADNRTLREQFYQAYCTRASDLGPNAGKWDNSEIMVEILQLRQEEARLLGFKHYADYSLATKMANSTQQVIGFLQDLAQRSHAGAVKELASLQAFATAHYQAPTLQPWDIGYYSEKYRQEKLQVSQEALRPYFPVNQVLQGLFTLLQQLFGFTVRARADVDVYHPEVQFYEVLEPKGTLRGAFYIDLYARAHKRGGAWMDDCRTRNAHALHDIQKPVAYLTCNFTPPLPGKTALLTHDEVETLFHEFGHVLHHILSTVNYPEVSGIHGVAWDAVELPSQFMENFCWREEVLHMLSGHVETGEKLPKAMLDKLLAARTFQAGMQMMRQVEFSLFDFKLHAQAAPQSLAEIQTLIDAIRTETSVLTPPAYNRFQHSFSHIFAGGYAAGYYSYKWAEVLSADAFSRFEEEGVFNPQVGRDFLQHILEQGGSAEPMELFIAFRGREPKIDALLKHSGI